MLKFLFDGDGESTSTLEEDKLNLIRVSTHGVRLGSGMGLNYVSHSVFVETPDSNESS